MNPSEFSRTREPRWQQLEGAIAVLEQGKKKHTSATQTPLDQVPSLFRQVCADLALARHRCMPPLMLERLNGIALRCCQQLYARRTNLLGDAGQFFWQTFPQAVRKEWRIVSWCHALFWVPFFVLLFWGDRDPRWFEAILGPGQMQQLHDMYDNADTLREARDGFGSNFGMFAFYIWNNVGITFKAFASGILAGVGSLLVTLFNGVMIGASAGYITRAANAENFWSFVAGHGAFELTGIVLGGAAGLRMGLALISPGPQTRFQAMAAAAHRALPILIGAASMVVAAAFIEGFWSPQPFPPMVKYVVGGVLWILTGAYFALAGREGPQA